MKYLDNVKQLEKYVAEPNLDVLWALEAVAVKGRSEAYCPRCGKMYTNNLIGKYDVRRCVFCHQRFFLYKKEPSPFLEPPKKRTIFHSKSKYKKRSRKNECS